MKQGKFGIEGLRETMSGVLAFLFVTVVILLLLGLCVTFKRGLHPCCFITYGILLFFFGFIPFVTEGDALRRFGSISESEL